LLAEPAVKLSSCIRELVCDMHKRWQARHERIGAFDKEFIDYARHDEHTRRLITIPGIGALNATALVAAVGDARTDPNDRRCRKSIQS
jgi:transposase